MAAMFSRKPAYAASAPAPEASGDLRARLMAAAANPYIAASGAAWSSTLRAKAMTLAPRTGL